MDTAVKETVTVTETTGAAELQIMRQMAEAVTSQTKFFGELMATQTKAIERLGEKVDGLNERLIHMEAANTARNIEKLEEEIRRSNERHEAAQNAAFKRIADLEGTKNQATGALQGFAWLRASVPWLIALVMGGLLLAGVDIRPKGP